MSLVVANAFVPPVTADPLTTFLQFRQMYVDGSYLGFDWPRPPKPGTAAELSR